MTFRRLLASIAPLFVFALAAVGSCGKELLGSNNPDGGGGGSAGETAGADGGATGASGGTAGARGGTAGTAGNDGGTDALDGVAAGAGGRMGCGPAQGSPRC